MEREAIGQLYEWKARPNRKPLIIRGARQVGKTFIIREVGKKLYKNFVEINMIEDNEGAGLFRNVTKVDDFLLRLSIVAGEKLGDHDDTLIFIDEIQQ